MRKTRAICAVCVVMALLLASLAAEAASPFFEAWPSNVADDPAIPISGLIGHGESAVTAVPDAALNVYLNTANDDWEAPNPTLIPMAMQAFPGGNTWEIDSFFDITYMIPSGDFAVDSFFDITFDIDPASGGPTPSLHALPSVDFAVDSFFDITYQIDFSDGAYSTIALHTELLSGSSLIDVSVTGNMIDSFFDIFVTVDVPEMTLSREDSIMVIGMTGSYVVPEPATLSLLVMGGLTLLKSKRK